MWKEMGRSVVCEGNGFFCVMGVLCSGVWVWEGLGRWSGLASIFQLCQKPPPSGLWGELGLLWVAVAVQVVVGRSTVKAWWRQAMVVAGQRVM